MNKVLALSILSIAMLLGTGPAHAKKTHGKPATKRCVTSAKPAGGKKTSTQPAGKGAQPGKQASKTELKTANAKPASPPPGNETPKPAADDPDRERLLHLQEALDGVVHGKVLGRLRVGMRVEELSTGRVLYGWRSSVLMDPASNQKVLSTTTALLRLGADYRYRTEVTGAEPAADGTVTGDVVLRGSGDPSLRARHIDALAEAVAARGVTRVTGNILGDPRRIGSDEIASGGRSPLRVGSTSIEVHVRPGDKVGAKPWVSVRPQSDAFVIVNQAETRAKGKGRIGVDIGRAGNRIQVTVTGKISIARGEVVVNRAPPSAPLYAAMLLRHALMQAGVEVEGGVGTGSGENRARVSSRPSVDGALLALGQPSSDSVPGLAPPAAPGMNALLAVHESDPLAMLLRRVNKDSDNEWAERVLETVGAEVMGGAASTGKGVRVLRDALADLELPAGQYLPSNGSGLGHQNRVTATFMTELFRRIYFDPRIGPELAQSLSVGGVDGTTRNRFRGTSASHRVRAKTGTLNGVSCLSGLVGDGSDILAFSILVEGHRKRSVPSVRAAQVSAVNAMMHFVRRATGPVPAEEAAPGGDLETGDEIDEFEGPAPDIGDGSEPAHVQAQPVDR